MPWIRPGNIDQSTNLYIDEGFGLRAGFGKASKVVSQVHCLDPCSRPWQLSYREGSRAMSQKAVPVSILVREDRDAIVAQIGGEIDMATAPLVTDSVRPFRGRIKQLVYELHNVSFIDSTGVDGLFDGGLDGERIVIRHPSPQVRRVLELLELESSIDDTAGSTYSARTA